MEWPLSYVLRQGAVPPPPPHEILFALGNICHSETPGKESFSRVAKFYKIECEILEAEQKTYASFRRVRGLGYMTAD